MTRSDTEFGFRRILVALDGTAHTSGAPEAAAVLAASLHAELEVVYVQDIELARLAALPIGREIHFLTGKGRNFTADALDSHNLELEACARRAIAAAAARTRIEYAFRVTSGRVRTEVLGAAHRADLLIVGMGGDSPGGRARLGGTARAAVEHAPRSVMISKPGMSAIARPLVYHDGTEGAKRAFQAAIRLLGARDGELVVLIDSNRAPDAEALRRDVESGLASAGVKHRILSGIELGPDRLCRLAAKAGADVLVIEADSGIIAGERRLQVLESIDCPVLLVR